MKLTTTLLSLCVLSAILATFTLAQDDVRSEVDKREDSELQAREESLRELEETVKRIVSHPNPYPGYKPWWRRSTETQQQRRVLRALMRRGFFSWVKDTYNGAKDKIQDTYNDVKEKVKDKWDDIKEGTKTIFGKRRI